MSAKIIGLPWVEKYRPNKLDDLISHQEIISTIQKFIDNQQLPHLLFYGPPGTGKTSTILAVAKQLYGVKNFKKMVLELNASDDRGIGVVRSEILNFASTASLHCKGFKVIILDECDAMTRDAQAALRRVMEKYTKNVRFCLICNYLGKLIPAIQSRCTRFRFAPLSKDQMMPRINHVVEEEGINIDQSGMELLLKLAEGDMRRSLNILQASHLAFNKVTEDIVYKVTGRPNRNDIRKLMEWLLNQDIKYCIENIQELMIENGLALNDVLTDLYEEVCEADLPEIPKAELLSTLADIEYRLNIGASEKIQLAVIVAAFSKVRNTVPRMEE
ncbi:Oidioi.mRNA.OKI2018_I69.chr1.g1005.t1.cds [Oikopleura dioica]|uniref:Oidioi.mRNA.OKI2018_I69.chr1.g1005.t1.cds n=1 Tax=Oikopleura dioica TaxID=34765 RepID=A0ABN7STR1_OIKDI|nr:Oidioi.mRNA.OKI2018_I69.chr1.g1005.t1.cds [Oikopleura dioica]